MRWSSISRVFALSLATLAFADNLVARSPKAKDASLDEVEEDAFGRPIKSSTFNGQEVPPLKELDAKDWDSAVSKGYWLVEFFSPGCHHCKAFAPTLQTFYELYYTSEPIPVADETPKSFTEYYDFHFGRVNCVAFGDICQEADIKSFPSLVLMKNKKMVKKSVGGKSMEQLGEWMEELLEDIKPGSRPKKGLTLPKVGADHVEGYELSSLKAKAKETAKQSKDIEEDLKAGAESKTTSSGKPGKTDSGKKKGQANPDGRSVALTAEDFTARVTSTQNPWFIKFYAPWCPHCQHLAPTWQAVARDMEGKLNIGEVNCDVEKRLCKDVHIKGYPTLIYFQGGERLEYEGLRGFGDLLSFSNKAVAAGGGVKDVSAAEFEEMEKTEEVIFLYLYDHATTSEDFMALERLTIPLISRAKLVKSNDPKLYKRFKVSTWPRMMVSRDGKPSYYTPLAPRDMRDKMKVLRWMERHWQPIVPEITASNAKEIMAGKLVVLGILSRDRADEFIIAKREIKNAALEWMDKQTQAFQLERQELRDAKQLRIEEAEDRDDQRALRNAKSIRINMDDIERKAVAFAWVDGVFWERWVKTTYGISVRDGERVVINDEENHRYWDTTITGNPIVPSRTSILETLPKIVSNPPKLSPKSTASFFGHIYFSLRRAFLAHPILTIGAVVILIFAAVLYVRGPSGQRRGGHARGDSLSSAQFMSEKKGWGNTGGFFQLPLNGGKEGSAFGGLLGNNGAGQKAD
ncbi:disulfide isomeras-like protein [Myriangium duriaei CBS 260.36]|uniref:Disulfide isomeras-like protein n=1 Tax=Myriangium duriaei CBS 260.36 TaxID=1168546 RepID=A0A9P4J407_9PEZI|nr:disulfide isomeras-like protein [Myriangium duriaei CBS 260.36]